MIPSICEKCGKEVSGGAWPFCPHPPAGRAASVIDDTLTGGARWMHNLGPEPVWVETKSQLNRELQSRGLVIAERNNYSKDDKSPWATRDRLRPGQRDPFLHRAKRT